MSDYIFCIVCREPIPHGTAHTFHPKGCPARDNDVPDEACRGLSECGEDCHPECCPTCNDLDERLSR